MAETAAKTIMNYFGYASAAAFMADWKKMSDTDKAQLRDGITNGSLTY